MGRLRVNRRVTRISVDELGSRLDQRPDSIAVEEPLELRLNGESVVVTMRLPGHDIEWLHGFLYSEGYITDRSDVVTAQYCAGSVASDDGQPVNTYNLIDLTLRAGLDLDGRRHPFMANSSCGVCGTASIEQLRRDSRFTLHDNPLRVSAATLVSLPDKLRDEQSVFARTGTVHAAGLFTAEGELVVAREDVGRHNAVDKVAGWALMDDRLPLSECILVVSSRASFEIVQKAQLAGIAMVATVSGATSLAVEAAEDAGMTLAGFVRPGRATVYTRPDRLEVGHQDAP